MRIIYFIQLIAAIPMQQGNIRDAMPGSTQSEGSNTKSLLQLFGSGGDLNDLAVRMAITQVNDPKLYADKIEQTNEKQKVNDLNDFMHELSLGIKKIKKFDSIRQSLGYETLGFQINDIKSLLESLRICDTTLNEIYQYLSVKKTLGVLSPKELKAMHDLYQLNTGSESALEEKHEPAEAKSALEEKHEPRETKLFSRIRSNTFKILGSAKRRLFGTQVADAGIAPEQRTLLTEPPTESIPAEAKPAAPRPI
eukprot:NODE_174_length_15906_cov_0.510533.p7 type:complete len:252 gc:universal NODE_174_length_15906_cov_0.510533:11236-11991(+)